MNKLSFDTDLIKLFNDLLNLMVEQAAAHKVYSTAILKILVEYEIRNLSDGTITERFEELIDELNEKVRVESLNILAKLSIMNGPDPSQDQGSMQ